MIIAKKTNKKQAASYCLSFALHELLLYAVNAFLSPVTATVILLDSLSYLYILFDKISLKQPVPGWKMITYLAQYSDYQAYLPESEHIHEQMKAKYKKSSLNISAIQSMMSTFNIYVAPYMKSALEMQ